MIRTRSTTPASAARINENAGSGGKYDPVAPGYYLARVTGAKTGTYVGGQKGLSGQFTYLKMTPEFVLLNDDETEISRQDFVLGAIDDEGFLYRPDGDDSKPALYAKAAFLIGALGFVDEDDNVDLETFDTSLLCGQIVNVKVANEPYTSRDGEERVKNVIVGTFPLRDKDLDRHADLYVAPNGMVFQDEKEYDTYLDLLDEALNGADSY